MVLASAAFGQFLLPPLPGTGSEDQPEEQRGNRAEREPGPFGSGAALTTIC